MPPELVLTLNFLETYTDFSEDSRKHFRNFLSPEILHIQQTLFNTST